MSTWLTIPSARPAAEAQACIEKWSQQGYRCAIWRDTGDDPVLCDYLRIGDYQGYARTTNALIKEVLAMDPECDWVVCGGDDTDPDPNRRADEIAAECSAYFGSCPRLSSVDLPGVAKSTTGPYPPREYETFGVMQPVKDRYAGGSIDRIAGSSWIGREYCLRANKGAGPFWPEFLHMHGDECLKRTAEKLGVYWMRQDLLHHHRHFMRQSDAIDSPAVHKAVPPHLVRWNSAEHWRESSAIFKRLESEDFASCMPLP